MGFIVNYVFKIPCPIALCLMFGALYTYSYLVHPSIFLRLFRAGSEERSPDLPLLGHLLELVWGNTKHGGGVCVSQGSQELCLMTFNQNRNLSLAFISVLLLRTPNHRLELGMWHFIPALHTPTNHPDHQDVIPECHINVMLHSLLVSGVIQEANSQNKSNIYN